MSELFGLPVGEAVALLEAQGLGKPVQVIETSGYKASEDLSNYTDTRVVGIRSSEIETVLIIARF